VKKLEKEPAKCLTRIEGGTMRGRLMKNLIQEVPEELSVCEYGCRNDTCSPSDWAQCELRQQELQGRRYTVRSDNRAMDQQAQSNKQPFWLYEVVPFMYLLAGFACFYYFDSLIGYEAGALLLTAAILIWVMRFKYRASKVFPADTSRSPHRSDR
jgi:hypothetical protein